MIDSDQLIDEPLGDHQIAGFTSGDSDCDGYCSSGDITKDRDRDLSSPYVVIDKVDGKIVGYFTLANHLIEKKEVHRSFRDQMSYDRGPATLIGMLARHIDLRGQSVAGVRIGDFVLGLAFRRCLRASQECAACAIIVHTRDTDARAQDLYRRNDFRPFKSAPHQLYISIRAVRQALA